MFEKFKLYKSKVTKHLDEAIEIAKLEKRETLAGILNDFKESFSNIRYNIAIIGNMKRGKSTLLNALMGRNNDDISPIASKVCTAVIIHYLDYKSAGFDKEQAVIHFLTGETREVALSEVRQYITEDNNRKNSKEVKKVEVFGDFPLLNDSVSIIDTPGLGSINEHHDTMVNNFLPLVDAIILPITADLPIEASERQFLEMLSEEDLKKLFFVVTKMDSIDEDEVKETLEFISSQISDSGLQCNHLYKTSAKLLHEAYKSEASQAEIKTIKKSSGIEKLENDLEAHILATSDKNQILTNKVKFALTEIDKFTRAKSVECEKSLESLNLDIYALEDQLTELEVDADKLRKRSEVCLKKFAKSWDRAVNKFKTSFEQKADRISDKIIDAQRNDGLIKAGNNTLKITSHVTTYVRQEAEEPLMNLEDKLQSALTELQQDFDDEVQAYYRKKESHKLIEIGTSGVTAFGVGAVGFASASAIGSSFTALTAAYTTYLAAGTATTAASSSAGAVFTLWGWLFGSSTTVATQAVATTAAAQTVATTALLTSGAAFVATAGVAAGAVWLTSKIAKGGLVMFQENRIPTLVNSTITDVVSEIVKNLKQQFDAYDSAFEDSLNEEIEASKSRINEIKTAIESSDPRLKVKMVERKERLSSLLDSNELLVTEIKLLGD